MEVRRALYSESLSRDGANSAPLHIPCRRRQGRSRHRPQSRLLDGSPQVREDGALGGCHPCPGLGAPPAVDSPPHGEKGLKKPPLMGTSALTVNLTPQYRYEGLKCFLAS
jgi:hypothetical protein